MSDASKLMVVAVFAVAGGVVLAQTSSAPGGGAARFDPFRPELSLNASPAPAPATQPAFSLHSVQSSGTIYPTIRDPLRPPTRSPFRP
jgi:hypothetical protein